MSVVVQVADAVRSKSEGVVGFHLVAVDTSAAKEELVCRAKALRDALLQWVAETWTQRNAADADK